MRDLLFLAHRIPYPPDKGDKIRSFHILDGLSKHFRIHLGAFIDDRNDIKYIEKLRGYCASLYLPVINPWFGQLRGIPAAISGSPLSLSRYRHAGFARWVSSTIENNDIGYVYAFSSAMGRYGLTPSPYIARRVMDFVDMDSEKWRQYANQVRFPMRMVYKREARTLATEESALVGLYDASVLVSEDETALFRGRNLKHSKRVHTITNGVNIDYFDPNIAHENPFLKNDRNVVFTGAMNYQANVDGVIWFCKYVWPSVVDQLPSAKFYVVGQKPVSAVSALSQLHGVIVTGRVPDVRPFIAHADVICAPLRVARGIQNKVLEALAMGKPVVGTSAAWEGIGSFSNTFGIKVDTPNEFANAILFYMRTRDEFACERRHVIAERFHWPVSIDKLIRALLGDECISNVAGRREI